MVSKGKLGRLTALLGLVAVAATGCRGCLSENVVYEHVFNRPDPRYCGTCVGKACPTLIPEFEPPPGGPYLPVPAAPRVLAPQPISVAPLRGSMTRQQITEERSAPAPLLPEVTDK